MKVEITTVKQLSNELLGTETKEIHYIVITNEKGNKVIINVGEKTKQKISKLMEDENN